MLRAIDHHVARPRLLAAHVLPPVVVVRGDPGSGKSVLLDEFSTRRGVPVARARLTRHDDDVHAFLARLRQALTHAGFTTAAIPLVPREIGPEAAVDALCDHLRARDDAVVIALDGVHHLRAEAVEILVRLAAAFPDGHHLVMLTQQLDGPYSRLRLLTSTIIEDDDLAFSDAEATALLNERIGLDLTARQVSGLVEATAGLPLRLVVAGRYLAGIADPDDRSDELKRLVGRRNLIPDVVDAVLEQRGRSVRRGLVKLAGLPWFDAELAEAVTHGRAGFEAASDAGLLASDPDGRSWLPDPVAAELTERGGLSPRSLRRAARVYAERGELTTAAHLLADAALDAEAADLLASATSDQLADVDVSDLARIIDGMDDPLVAERPRLLLELARAWHRAGAPTHQHAALHRATRVATDPPARLAYAFEAEHLRDAALGASERCDEERRRAVELLELLHPSDQDLRGRLLECLGHIAVLHADDDWADEARALFAGAIESYDRAGDPWSAAVASTALAAAVELADNDASRALAALRRPVALAAEAPVLASIALVHRAHAHGIAQRPIHAAADRAEAQRLAGLLGDDDIATRAREPLTDADTMVEIGVFDGLRVAIDGTESRLPRGLSSQLVKLLAVRGGRLHQDEVARELWPDIDPGDAIDRIDGVRRRLGNAAAAVQRDGDFVCLAPGAHLDIATFIDAARAATADGIVDPVVGRYAAEHFGELLPGDDEDWISITRQRLRTTALELLDGLLDHALKVGDVDDALHWARRSWQTDPHDPQRQQRYQQLLMAHGHTRRAASLEP